MTYHLKRIQARKLRTQGHSYSSISNEIGISKSTLSYWLRDIPYNPNQETRERLKAGKLKAAIHKNRIKLESIKRAEMEAKKEVGELSKRDIFMVGLGLYIGEGSKTGGHVRIANSDPRMIVLAMKWFKEACGCKQENFRLAIHLYPDNNIERCLAYWSKVTGIPRSQFGKTQIDRREHKKSQKRGKLGYGTAQLSVRGSGKLGVYLARKIEAWSNNVLNQ